MTRNSRQLDRAKYHTIFLTLLKYMTFLFKSRLSVTENFDDSYLFYLHLRFSVHYYFLSLRKFSDNVSNIYKLIILISYLYYKVHFKYF